MQSHQKDVTLISIFGRGHWLASELAQLGLSVALVDLSPEMGRWTPEDWEGPFGFFRSDYLTSAQISRLEEDEDTQEVENGFIVWSEEGPLEMRGPMSSFLLSKYKIDEPLKKYVETYDSLTVQQRAQLKSELKARPFRTLWPLHLAHQLAANVYRANASGIDYGYPSSLFSPYFIRRASRKGFDESLQRCVSLGVEVFSKVKLVDFKTSGNWIEGVELTGQHSGMIGSHKWVWALSSQESVRIPEEGRDKLFPEGAIEASWCWIRFRISVESEPVAEVLPEKFVFINDLHLPWSHSNLAIVQRAGMGKHFDCWVRIPSQQRFQRPYCEKIYQELGGHLTHRLSGIALDIVEMPQDYVYNFQEMGPPRFPVYEPDELQRLVKTPLKNVIFDGPEYWTHLDWEGQFRHQVGIFKELRQWWAETKLKEAPAPEVTP